MAFLAAVAKQIDVIPDDLSVQPWVLPAYALSLVAYLVGRAGRWWFLVRPLGEVSWTTTTHVGLAGIMWVVLLPFRLGELARPVLLAQVSSVGIARALGTVAIERVVDGLFVCGLFFLTLGGPDPSGDVAPALYDVARVVMAGFAAALVVLVMMARFPGAMGRLVDGTIGYVAPALGRKLASLADGVAHGLAALPSALPLMWFLLCTAAYWAVNVLGVWMLAHGCGLDLGLAEAGGVVAIIAIGLLVPAGPGQLGNFQGAGLAALAVFATADIVHTRGAVFLFWLYAMQLSVIVAGGLYAHRRLPVDWRAAWPGNNPGRDHDPA